MTFGGKLTRCLPAHEPLASRFLTNDHQRGRERSEGIFLPSTRTSLDDLLVYDSAFGVIKQTRERDTRPILDAIHARPFGVGASPSLFSHTCLARHLFF
jgi:hypothetical protein